MTGPAGILRVTRWTVALGLIGLALAVPFSAPDGTGMQWDELVLACVAGSAAWSVFRLTRGMDAVAARPWRVVVTGATLFMIAQLLAGLFPGPEFDGFGIDDVILLLGASSPVVTCALLARQVRRTRWPALMLDGAIVTAALLVVTEVLRTPLVNPVDAPEDLRSLVLTYGAYAAVMLGGAGTLCTVSTAALRRSATMMMGAVACQASAACAEAMAIVAPSWVWVATSDVSVALGLQAVALAAAYAPTANSDRSARAAVPCVSPWGMALVVLAMLGVPVAIGYGLLTDHPHSHAADVGVAVLLSLIAVRLGLRVREDSRVTEDLVRSDEDFRSLVESSSDGVAIVDADELRLLFTSPAARHMLGLLPDGAQDCSLLDLVHAEDRALVHATLGGTGHPVLHFRVPREHRTGELEATSSERPGSGRRVLYLRDVTSRRERERELERMAYTDHLTALANRAHLFQEMAAPADGALRSLLVLDLDGFKAVNDVAGHEAGDHLLVEVARRLHTLVRDDDLVARLGGDEFAVLVTGSLTEATDVAHRVVDAMAMPHRVGDWTFAVGASVGVAPLGAGGGQLAFREADTALRAAKRAGKGCVRVADGAHATTAVPAFSNLSTLTAEGSLELRLDSLLDPGGSVVLVHAYPVWIHPLHGAVRGQELYAAAERSGISADLQNWLIREACTRVAALPDTRLAVAVNLPAGHVIPEGLADEVTAALTGSDLAPSRLVLSISEETLLTSSPTLIPQLEAVRRSGVRICLDNYGMGSSLFALLARMSLDILRVNLPAVAGRDDIDRSLQVLGSITRTAADFGLLTVAGGITTPELRDAAVSAGADLVHGRNQPHDLTVADLAELLVALPAG